MSTSEKFEHLSERAKNRGKQMLSALLLVMSDIFDASRDADAVECFEDVEREIVGAALRALDQEDLSWGKDIG